MKRVEMNWDSTKYIKLCELEIGANISKERNFNLITLFNKFIAELNNLLKILKN